MPWIEMVNKKLVFRDWTFLRFNLCCGPCYLAHWDDSNDIYDLWYHRTFTRFFWFFMSKVQYQKVVRLSTWVVESNSSVDKMKVWLNISQRVKFQDNPLTGWVGTVRLEMVGQLKSRFQEPRKDAQSFVYNLIFSEARI